MSVMRSVSARVAIEVVGVVATYVGMIGLFMVPVIHAAGFGA